VCVSLFNSFIISNSSSSFPHPRADCAVRITANAGGCDI